MIDSKKNKVTMGYEKQVAQQKDVRSLTVMAWIAHGLNVVYLCTCLFCKPRPLHVRACWCRERVCHASAVKGCHISLRIEL